MTQQKQQSVRTETEALQRAGRFINLLVWMVAAVVMVFSALTGADLLAAHGVDKNLGLAGGLAVDAALVVALIGDRQLHRYGQRTPWGTALRWVTTLFSLVLNCGQSASGGNWEAAGLHAIFPVLLIVLTEASQGYQLAFSRAVLQAKTATEYRTESVSRTPSTSVSETTTAISKSPSTAGSKSRERTGARSTAVSDKPAQTRTQSVTNGWDDELWSRAWQLFGRYQREHGRPPKLGEFHTELRMSRNAASPLRNAILSQFSATGSGFAESGSDVGLASTANDETNVENGTGARVVQLHTTGTGDSDTDQVVEAQ